MCVVAMFYYSDSPVLLNQILLNWTVGTLIHGIETNESVLEHRVSEICDAHQAQWGSALCGHGPLLGCWPPRNDPRSEGIREMPTAPHNDREKCRCHPDHRSDPSWPGLCWCKPDICSKKRSREEWLQNVSMSGWGWVEGDITCSSLFKQLLKCCLLWSVIH